MKIRTKIIAAFLMVSLVSISLLIYVVYYFSKIQLLQVRGEQLQTLAAYKKQDLQNVSNSWHDRVQLIASRTRFRQLFSKYLEKPDNIYIGGMKIILSDAIKSVSTVKQLTLFDLSGREVLSAGNRKLHKSVCDPLLTQSRKTVWLSDIWMGTDKKLYVKLCAPVILNKQTLGVMLTVVDAKELLAVVNNYTGLGKTGETLIARRNDGGAAQFVTPLRYHPNHGLELTVLPHKEQNPITIALREKDLFLSEENYVDYRGKPVLSATAYVPELDWGVVVKIDRGDALSPMNVLLQPLLFYVLVISFLIIIFSFIIARTLTNPLVVLKNTASKISSGDLSQRAETNSKDEVGELAQTFNKMLAYLEEKVTESAESEQRNQIILNNTVDAIITIDSKGSIVSVNKAFKSIFGYEEDEVIGRNVRLLMPETHQDSHPQYIKSYLNTGAKKIIGIVRETQGKRKDGEEFPIELSVSDTLIKGEHFFTGIIRDVSERKKFEEDQEQLLEMLSKSNFEFDEDGLKKLEKLISLRKDLDISSTSLSTEEDIEADDSVVPVDSRSKKNG